MKARTILSAFLSLPSIAACSPHDPAAELNVRTPAQIEFELFERRVMAGGAYSMEPEHIPQATLPASPPPTKAPEVQRAAVVPVVAQVVEAEPEEEYFYVRKDGAGNVIGYVRASDGASIDVEGPDINMPEEHLELVFDSNDEEQPQTILEQQ